MILGQLGFSHAKECEEIPYTKCKWVIHLNVRAQTIKFLKENMEVDLCNFGLANYFLDTTPKYKQQQKKNR